MDNQLPQDAHTSAPIPEIKKPRDTKKIRKSVLYILLVVLGAGAAYAIITNPKTGWIPTVAYIILASIAFAYRKPIIEGKQALHTTPEQPSETTTEKPLEPSVTPLMPKVKPKMKHILLLSGIGLGCLIFLFIIVSIFQPRMYLWFVASQKQANHEVTATVVDVIRTLTLKEATEGVEPGTSTQTIALNTDTKFVAPASWEFVTWAKSEAQGLNEGVEVVVVDNTAYQRTAGTSDAFSKYEFSEDEYNSTVEAIKGSSFFQEGVLTYMKTPRFVFNTDGQPWWMLHYRVPIDVDALDAASPDWYSADIYAFAKDPSLTSQQVEFTLDVWINPFTRKVSHEQWMVTKVSNEDEQYSVKLDIFMDRTFSYPKDLTIEAPTATTTTE